MLIESGCLNMTCLPRPIPSGDYLRIRTIIAVVIDDVEVKVRSDGQVKWCQYKIDRRTVASRPGDMVQLSGGVIAGQEPPIAGNND